MKAIWKGSIGFGLVNIPVRMFSAVENSSLDLDMLDKKDHSNIRFKRVNEKTGKEVTWENIVRGYYVNDRYVVLEKSDFERASPEKSNTIEIKNFTEEKDIDSNYFESPYFLEPDKAGARAYCLLKDALQKTGMAGVGLFVMHNREHVCILRAVDDLIMLNRLRFAQELRTPDELNIPHLKSKPDELKMAVSLVKQLSKGFDISKYKDQYSDKLLEIIRAKSKGKLKPYKPMKVVHAPSKDLIGQLKASLSSKKMAS
ncbi:MAG TPA: Ku protein [Chitinophagaceae bacterium]